MSNSPPDSALTCVPILFVGIDWADQKHDVHWIAADGRHGRRQIEHSPEQIEALVASLQELAEGGQIAVALEKSRGPLWYALMFRERLTLYPLDPKQLARYRASFSSGGAKSDASDAQLLARLLCEQRHQELRAWRPDDEPTRRLAQLCQARRQLVDERTRLLVQLQSLLKAYFPLLLTLAGQADSPLLREVLRRWPDPRKFRREHPKTLAALFRRHGVRNEERLQELMGQVRTNPILSRDVAQIEALSFRAAAISGQLTVLIEAIEKTDGAVDQALAQHPDASLFQGVPAAGRALRPRLLAAFGSDRTRYANAQEVAVVSGIAPVTRQSGKTRIVARRRACPRFLKQTFHEFADHARKWCPWSKAYYQLQRSRQMAHHAAVRKLASRWIRILFRVWLTRTPYDPNRYVEGLRRAQHPLLKFLQLPTPTTKPLT